MRRSSWGTVAGALMTMMMVAGCGSATMSNGADVNDLSSPESWEDAKAHAQERMLAIFDSVPGDQIDRVDPNETGTLLSCDDGRHRWIGSSEIFFVDSVDPNLVVRDLEEKFRSSGYELRLDETLSGDPQVQLVVPRTPENYLFAKEADHSIRVQAGSACFTLPEDVWPRGEF